MKVYRSIESFEAGAHTVATIGTFDGVHVGHRVILDRLIKEAQAANGESVLISFHPHPRLVLFPDHNPLRLLQTLDEKIEHLSQTGLDKLLIIPFTKAFSRLPSKAFIKDILVGVIKTKKIIIGYDHHFGKNRTGSIDELRSLSEKYHYEVEEISAKAIDEANVSSTKIRRALQNADLATANKFLAYSYSLAGQVVHGQKQGRELGYPTANIMLDEPRKLIPADGIYLVKVQVRGKEYYGLMSIGKKPTMGEFERTLEVNILDFAADIYGEKIRVFFIEYIRAEKKFDSLQALISAMDADKAYSLARIQQLENS